MLSIILIALPPFASQSGEICNHEINDSLAVNDSSRELPEAIIGHIRVSRFMEYRPRPIPP
jgi:hypothetical protein